VAGLAGQQLANDAVAMFAAHLVAKETPSQGRG
jgi:hypothetical protein